MCSENPRNEKNVFINGKYYIDLEHMVQKDICNYELPLSIKRISYHNRLEYNLTSNFISNVTTYKKHNRNSNSLMKIEQRKDDSGQNWLGYYFFVYNGGKFPTPNQIFKGIIDEAMIDEE